MIAKRQLIGKSELCRRILDAMPLPVFVVDEDLMIVDFNAAARDLLGVRETLILRHRGGEILQCIHSKTSGCGRGKACKSCPIRKSVGKTISSQKSIRQRAEMDVVEKEKNVQKQYFVTTSPFTYSKRKLVLLILEDISELTALRKMLPVCVQCRKIRDDQDYWHRIDHYLAANFQLDVSHGLCPDCRGTRQSLTPVLSGQRRLSRAD